MIAKILKSSQSFSGVIYNERKNGKGQSELMVAKKFAGLDNSASKQDYINYLHAFAKCNDRVKNIQFHATISCKGREHSFEELSKIALKWSEKMGYGEQPILIYAHSDTANNHVHVVSVRVDKFGERIKDSYERIRSQKALNEILNNDYKLKADKDFKMVSSYSFSTVPQFKFLLENSGWNIVEKTGSVHLIKGGEVQRKISKSEIENLIEANRAINDEQRSKQVKALIYKYKAGLSHVELKKLMKEKFGIDLIYHTGKGHTKPYGYTLIDHNDKRVYKGSDLINIKELLVAPEQQGKIKVCSSIVNILLRDDKMDYNTFNKEMDQIGYDVKKNGKISIKGEKSVLFSLDKNDLNKLYYNDRLKEANKFNVQNRAETIVLSKLFFVKAKDISVSEKDRDFKTVFSYAEMMNSYLSNRGDVKQEMKDKGISFIKMGKDLYLVDAKNKEVISNKDLNIDLSDDRKFVQILETDAFNDFDLDKNHKVSSTVFIDTLSEFLEQNYSGEQDRKRKRKNGINQ